MLRRLSNALWIAVALAAPSAASSGAAQPEAGSPGGPGLAIRCAKALVCSPDPREPQSVDRALVLVRDGKIEAVRPSRDGAPEGYELLDVGDNWVMPGEIGLHSHVGGTFDINDMVYQTNPGLSTRTAIIPRNPMLERGLAGGVTTVLYIPGSGTNIGGSGVLLKTGPERYEDALVRDPGSLKLAQWGNPESWAMGCGMAFEQWNTRDTFRRGLAYAKRWHDYEQGNGDEPEFDPQFELFRSILSRETQVSTHTQLYQVVLMTLTMIRGEFGVDVYLDHSTIGGWLTGAMCEEMGVPAIVGPRSVDTVSRGFMNWCRNKHEGMRGVAAGYQERGLQNVGFNTDAPVIPQETLQLQAAVGVRYGFDDSSMQAVRGLTVVPAMAAGLEDRIGSLRPGLDADLLVITGHPADPRSKVELVLIDGKRSYDAQELQLW